MNANDFISSVTANLTEWGINYSENTSGLTVGGIALEVSEGYTAATVTTGEEVVAITSDADKAATLLALPLARKAWQALCGATDFEQDNWMTLVERFHWRARFDQGDRFTKVSTSESDNVALVEEYDPESPIRVIDVDAVSDVTCWAQGDVAAAVLYAIS